MPNNSTARARYQASQRDAANAETRALANARSGRRRGKPHKSQPHAKPPRKSKVKKTPSWKTQPLFPGGITTKGEFVKNRQAATDQEFGPQEEQIAQAKREVPAWYDDYLKKLQGLQTQSVTQYQGLQNQAGSLAETVADATPEGKAAADARNNIVKSIQGALLQQQGAAGTHLGEMGAIAGARKTQKLDEISTAEAGLAKKKGDFKSTYTSTQKQTEFENALAAKQFGLKVEDAKTDRIKANKTETTYEKEFAKQASKHGFSSHDWAMLGPKGRAKRIQEAQTRSGSKPKSLKRIENEEAIKQAAKHGYSLDDWKALPPQKRSAIIRGTKPDKKDDGGEFDWQTPGQRGKGAKQAATWKNDPGIKKLIKKGTPRSEVAKQILASSKAPDNPVLVSALLDAIYDKHLSRETARRLQGAGYKAREIAKALGTPTFTEYRRQGKSYKGKSLKKKKKWIETILNPESAGIPPNKR